ncbi:MAG: hypothetical protein ACTJLL_04285 [Anaplasma sp.]
MAGFFPVQPVLILHEVRLSVGVKVDWVLTGMLPRVFLLSSWV